MTGLVLAPKAPPLLLHPTPSCTALSLAQPCQAPRELTSLTPAHSPAPEPSAIKVLRASLRSRRGKAISPLNMSKAARAQRPKDLSGRRRSVWESRGNLTGQQGHPCSQPLGTALLYRGQQAEVQRPMSHKVGVTRQRAQHSQCPPTLSQVNIG